MAEAATRAIAPPAWYLEWVLRYRTLYLLNDAWEAAAAEWYPAFASLRATAAEMDAATREVQVSDDKPQYLGDHLPAVKEALGRVRNRQPVETNAPGEDRGTCTKCGDTGYCTVPHPDFVVGGEWKPVRMNRLGEPVYATAAVACSCWKGQKCLEGARRLAETRGRRPPMSLGEYEIAVTEFWQWQIDRVRDEARLRRQIAEREYQAASEPVQHRDRLDAWPNLAAIVRSAKQVQG